MAIIEIENSGKYSPYKQQFLFTRTAILSVGQRAEVYWNGDPSKSWYPVTDSVYSGQINCLVSVIDSGGGSQSYGASNVEENNILFEYISGVSTIAHLHTYFKTSDANMNGTWHFSVNPINQGIVIEWEAPSGASNTTFKIQCIALVNSLYL